MVCVTRVTFMEGMHVQLLVSHDNISKYHIPSISQLLIQAIKEAMLASVTTLPLPYYN